MWQQYLQDIAKNDFKSIARCISLIENEVPGYEDLLQNLPAEKNSPVIGITGPPGAGKSTLTNALIALLVAQQKKVAVLCIDPSSPFNLGALLGDRIRMSEWYNSQNVFIRSLATKGSLGGLHPKVIEITDLLKAAAFDYILVETVGVGQSEIEIAGLADTTIVVLVPESGDEIQSMKSGLMEIADIFVVNKADRPGAEVFIKNLHTMLSPVFKQDRINVPVIKTIADKNIGVEVLLDKIQQQVTTKNTERKQLLLVEKAYQLLQAKRMQGISKALIKKEIENNDGVFNLYRFVASYGND
ncbi:MAG: methylmalonyl Co-A mutase-associated GTPase MeaB [Ferruginibacter sp.]